MEALDHGGVAVFALRGSVGALVVAAVNGLAELEGLGGLPGSVGGGGDDSCGYVSAQGGDVDDLVQRGGDFGDSYGCRRGEGYGDGSFGAGAEGEVEVEVGGVQPFGVNGALGVVDGGQDGVGALELGGVFHRYRHGIEGSGTGVA